MPQRYPNEFRRKVLDLLESGCPVVEIAAQLGVSDQTILNWRDQDQIDRGLRVGATTVGLAEPTVVRRANELLEDQAGRKGVGRSSSRS